MTSEPASNANRSPAPTEGLVLDAFRGVRYAAEKVGDLAAVTSPPYDVIEADAVLALESNESHNVVRLILPRDEECGAESRYEHAAQTLRSWLADGILRADESPALYVYEQASSGEVIQRGLIGNVGLRDPEARVVLPHEDVMPGPVADRLELMRAARANVEPILLMYDGDGGPTADILAAACRQPPLVSARTADAVTHRLWRLDDPQFLAEVSQDLAGRQALIADGHHRYAAYRALQSERDAAEGGGPWDSGLALLVDLRAHPPRVGAIHRTVADLALDDAVGRLDARFEARASQTADPLTEAARLQRGQMLVVGPDRRSYIVSVADRAAVDAAVVKEAPEQWRGLDTAVLHHVLLDQVWSVGEERIGYHHDVPGALRTAAREAGIAILLAPIAVETVLELAAEGVRMPRKSTSFGPKPRTGLVLRTFDTG